MTRVRGPQVQTLRAFVNLIFLGLWTASQVTYAVTMAAIRREPEFFRRQQIVWARGLLRFWGVELRVTGAEHMTPGSYVVMANHLSYADIVVLFLALPICPGFLAKAELTRVPFLSQALRSGGHVVIDRGNRAGAMAAIESAAEQVRAGKTVLIFPEGTRGDDDSIGAFKKGGFYLAKAARVPILPVGVRGSRAIFPRRSLLIRPGQVEVHIGAPLPPSEVESTEMLPLVAAVRARLMGLAAMPARARDPASPPEE